MVAAYNCKPMSQVTRCPSCGTRFKVVADQLRISQGWVRCGMCQSVFDASEDLQSVPDEVLQSAVEQAQAAEASKSSAQVQPEEPDAPSLEADRASQERAESHFDLNSSVPAEEAGAVVQPVSADLQAEPEPEVAPVAAGLEPEPPESSFIDHARPLLDEPEVVLEAVESTEASVLAQAEQAQDAAGKSVEVSIEMEPESVPEQADSPDVDAHAQAVSVPPSPDVDQVRREVDAAQPADDEAAAASSTAALDEPGFVRQARRQAFWHSRGMRVALVLGSVLAAGGMAAQYAWQQRDALAAEYPALAPVLAKACQAAGCELHARREIGDVVISGSGFKQLADAHQYQWSLTLENRSDTPVATPVAELTLTDAQDKPLLRRVVDLKSLGAPEQLQPRQEWSVNVPVRVQDLSAPVAGYRALVFYP